VEQGKSRATTEKTHLPKNVPFGAKIVYDGERCIKCTRCVRFTDEITQTHELSMGARGDKELVIMTSKGEFTTPYAMNIIDLCPVGALTSKDFRFESRVWFMDFTESICTGCARGCNVTVGARGGRVLRMTPRENQDVNRWWMCDAGRLGYGHANAPTRLTRRWSATASASCAPRAGTRPSSPPPRRCARPAAGPSSPTPASPSRSSSPSAACPRRSRGATSGTPAGWAPTPTAS
jgi:NADH-quinone oxidoreductase subunit G